MSLIETFPRVKTIVENIQERLRAKRLILPIKGALKPPPNMRKGKVPPPPTLRGEWS